MPNWSELVEKHGPMVWLVVRRLVSNEEDAADCFQETFIAALQLSRKQRILSWTATLRHLATVKAMDCLRRRYRNSSSPLDESPSELPDKRANRPDENLCSNELAAALRVALACIDPRHAEVFCLVCLEAMSYQETATMIGISENHVGVLLNRARTALKEKLEAYAPTSRIPKKQGENSNAKTK